GNTYLVGLGEPELAESIYAEIETILNALAQPQASPEQYRGIRARLAYCQADLALCQQRFPAAKLAALDSLRLYAADGDRWAAIGPQFVIADACIELGEYAEA